MIIDLLTNIPALLGGLAALVALFWGNGKIQRHRGLKQGRQDVADELSEAYNDTTKEIRNEQADIPSDADDVLERLHEYTK